MLQNLIESIITFVETICMDEYEPTVECLASSLGIIGDLCSSYNNRMKSYINQNKIRQIMSSIMKINSERYVDLIEWANGVIYF